MRVDVSARAERLTWTQRSGERPGERRFEGGSEGASSMLAELRFLLANADERCSASGPWVGWFSHAMPTAACIGPLLAAAMARKATRFARPTAVPLLTLNTAQLLRKGYWPGTGGSGRRHA